MGTVPITRWRHAILVACALMPAAAPQALADPADPVPSPAVAAEAVPVASAQSITPPDGIPHLPSPESLPPGATQTAPEHRNLSYLREIWQAVRGRDVSMSDALLLIAQRPMDVPNP